MGTEIKSCGLEYFSSGPFFVFCGWGVSELGRCGYSGCRFPWISWFHSTTKYQVDGDPNTQVMKTTDAGAEFDVQTSGSKIAPQQMLVKDAAQRERNWLTRGAKTSASLWKPKKLHRLQAMKWLCSLDHQFSILTGRKGLVHFKPDLDAPCWQDLRKWPFAALGMDLGSDGCSGVHGAMYYPEWKMNMESMQDHSHGANRSIYNSVKSCGLYGLVLLGVVSLNLQFGPDSEDLRHRQIKERMDFHYAHTKPHQAVLFQHLLNKIIEAMISMGYEFQSSGGAERELEVWAWLQERSVFMKQGKTFCMVRFGAVAAALRLCFSFLFCFKSVKQASPTKRRTISIIGQSSCLREQHWHWRRISWDRSWLLACC